MSEGNPDYSEDFFGGGRFALAALAGLLGALFAFGGLFRRFLADLACTLGLEFLGGRGGDDVDHEHLGIRNQHDAIRQRDRARGELGADVGPLHREGQLLGDRLDVGLDFDGAGVLGDQRSVRGLTLDDDVDLDGDLLAAAHHQQVGVLDVAADRVDVERLGQRELLLALDVEGEHGVGAGVSQHGSEVMPGQQKVLRVGAVAVEHRGDLALAPSAAGCALSGFGAHGSGQVVGITGRSLGHWCCSSTPVISRPRPGSQLRRAYSRR